MSNEEGKKKGKGGEPAAQQGGTTPAPAGATDSPAATPPPAPAAATAPAPEKPAPAAAPDGAAPAGEKKGLGPVYAILIVILLVIMGFQAYMIIKSLQNPSPTTPGQPVAGVPTGPQMGQPGPGAPGAPNATGKNPPPLGGGSPVPSPGKGAPASPGAWSGGPGGKGGPGGPGGPGGSAPPQGPPSPPAGSNIPPGQVALMASPIEVMYGAVLRVHTTPDTKLSAEQAAKIVSMINKGKIAMPMDQASQGFAANASSILTKDQTDFISKNRDVPVNLAGNKPPEGGDPTMKPVEEYLLKVSGATLDSVTAPTTYTPPTSNPTTAPASAEDVLHGLYHLQKAPGNLQVTKEQANKMLPWFKAFLLSRTQGISLKQDIANVMSQTQRAALEKNLLSAGQNPQQTDIRPLSAEQLVAALSGGGGGAGASPQPK